MAIGFLAAAAAVWTGAAGAGECMRAARDLASGAALTQSDTVAAPCNKEAPAALRYDRSAGVLIAIGPIRAGAYLGRICILPAEQVSAGARLVLRSTSGPVTIEREVTALQPARGGGRVFVRDAGGNVFAVPLMLVRK